MNTNAETEVNEGNQTFNEDLEESHDTRDHKVEDQEQYEKEQAHLHDDADEEYHENDEEEEQNLEDQANATPKDNNPTATHDFAQPRRRRRGRPPLKEKKRGLMISISSEPDLKMKYNQDEVPVDENGNIVDLLNDEYVLPKDLEGETKVNAFGELQGGRNYRVQTFTLPGRNQGKTLYVLGNDMARLLKYKDAYVFFLNYKTTLYKTFITDQEKEYLLAQGVLKPGIKSRTISVTTAKSCFREFGCKIVKHGRPGIDDYYVTTEAYPPADHPVSAKEVAKKFLSNSRGVHSLNSASATPISASSFSPSLTSGNFAPKQRVTPNTSNLMPSDYNARRTVEYFNMISSNMNISLNDKINKENWIFMHAQSCSGYNEDLFYEREKIQFIDNSGVRDPYTNTLHVPLFTQPKKILKKTLSPLTTQDKQKMLKKKIIYETRIKDDNLKLVKTGLSDLPLDLFKGFLDENVCKEIDKQVSYESKN
ncbi:hypothetical protein ACO0RG_001844 [Hanseniaspora osmophila]